jgi:hypothetical protein
MEFESVCLYVRAWAIRMVIPGQRMAILDPRLPAMAKRIKSVPFPKGSDLSFSLQATAKSMRGTFLALLRHSNKHLIALKSHRIIARGIGITSLEHTQGPVNCIVAKTMVSLLRFESPDSHPHGLALLRPIPRVDTSGQSPVIVRHSMRPSMQCFMP